MKTWTMKDGTKIPINKMGDSHLLNTIKFLERKHAQLAAETPYPDFQGEMAQFHAERERDQLQASDVSDVFPIYDDLVEEATKRNLFEKEPTP